MLKRDNDGIYWEFSNLSVIALDKEGHGRTCDYWYLVHEGAQSHTAFNKRENLLKWLESRGLTLAGLLPEHGHFGVVPVQGTYRMRYHMSYDAFFALEPVAEVRRVDNGHYTLARITQDDNGVRTEHVMNCNCKNRPEYDYAESRALVG